jgi:hypothetical protein
MSIGFRDLIKTHELNQRNKHHHNYFFLSSLFQDRFEKTPAETFKKQFTGESRAITQQKLVSCFEFRFGKGVSFLGCRVVSCRVVSLGLISLSRLLVVVLLLYLAPSWN